MNSIQFFVETWIFYLAIRAGSYIASYQGLPKPLLWILNLRLVASKKPPWISLKSKGKFNDLKNQGGFFLSYSSIVEYFASSPKPTSNREKRKKAISWITPPRLPDFTVNLLSGIWIRRMAAIGRKKSRKGKSGAKKLYPEDLLLPHITHLWESMDRISARRIKAALNDWPPYYHENGVSHRVKNLLRKMSASTLERFLVKVRKNKKGSLKGLCSTSPATYMKNKVPINTLDSSITRPGYIQTDTVAHCGDRLIGNFINSITYTDIFSTWTENRALFTKKGHEVRRCLSDCGFQPNWPASYDWNLQLNERGIEVTRIHTRMPLKLPDGTDEGDIDITAINGIEIAAGEVKTTLTLEKLKKKSSQLQTL